MGTGVLSRKLDELPERLGWRLSFWIGGETGVKVISKGLVERLGWSLSPMD